MAHFCTRLPGMLVTKFDETYIYYILLTKTFNEDQHYSMKIYVCARTRGLYIHKLKVAQMIIDPIA